MVWGQWPRRRWRESPGCEDCQALLNCSDYLVLIVAWWRSAVCSVIREMKPTVYSANNDESMDHLQGSKQLQPERELMQSCHVSFSFIFFVPQPLVCSTADRRERWPEFHIASDTPAIKTSIMLCKWLLDCHSSVTAQNFHTGWFLLVAFITTD